jgi:hypothetical protein
MHISKPFVIWALGGGGALAGADMIVVPTDVATIQAGLDVAAGGDTVQVLPGTYFEHGLDCAGKAIVVRGIDPADSSAVAATVVDGQAAGTVFYFRSGEGPDTILEGLTLCGGAGGLAADPVTGGGITCRDGAAPVVRDCVVRDCHSAVVGGGIGSWTSTPRIERCRIEACGSALYGGGIGMNGGDGEILDGVIQSCSADYAGGGLYCTNHAAPTVNGVLFTANSSAADGGGAYINRTATSITASRFVGNTAQVGGGLWLGGATALVVGCEFTGNEVLNTGGAIRVEFNDESRITHCLIRENYSGAQGGGIYLGSESLSLLTHLKVLANEAHEGGGVYAFHTTAILLNSILRENVAQYDGGAVLCYEAAPVIAHCTIMGNVAWDIGRAGGIAGRDSSHPRVASSVVWDNEPRNLTQRLNSFVDVTYSDVGGGWEGGVEVIDADPLLTTYLGYEWVPSASSPCIDAGDPAWEDGIYDADPWWPSFHTDGARSDMGAYGGPWNIRWSQWGRYFDPT